MRDSLRRRISAVLPILVGLVLCGCPNAESKPVEDFHILQVPGQPDNLPEFLNPETAGFLPHDESSFTQGLLFHDGFLYESTGRKGESKVRKLDPKSGATVAQTDLEPEFFGEGLAYFENSFYQLTWVAGVCLVYDENLKPTGQLMYGTQGWGLTLDPESKMFAFSDGSAEIRFLDPKNFVTKRRVTVTDGNGRPIQNLNELEWVNGELWANVWVSDVVARIDPNTGKVLGWVRFKSLVKENQHTQEDVLNGLAYDPESDTLWVTGKLWKRIYRIEKVKEKFFSQRS